MKIAIVGGPSTGKTTLVKRIAERLRRKRYKVAIVDDPARIYIEKWIRGKREMVIADQLWILRNWIEKERKAQRQNPDFVLCDGASFLSYNYCFLFKETPNAEIFRKEIRKQALDNLPSYDYIFFLPLEFLPKEDGVRLFTSRAYEISLKIRAFLDTYLWKNYYLWRDRKPPEWNIIKGDLKERVNKVLEIILKPC